MDLTIDDRVRMMILLRRLIAEAKADINPYRRLIRYRLEYIPDRLEWGEDMLRRLEALDEDR